MREKCSLSRTEAACMAGVGRGPNGIDELRALSANGTSNIERWYTVEQFEREHVIETLKKLEEGDLDDEIWGKIILMQKNKRLAKAYLRRTTVIIDGSSDEFDGITLGFNYFENVDCDEASDEIRRKIGDGVIIKVDENGNIKAMARGLAPVIVQGSNDPTSKCISEQLIAQKGHLITLKDRLKGITDQQRVEKIFDMRLFNLAIERELLSNTESNTTELLLKTCIRVALVKDVAINALKTPCWFMIVNLVALDVLRTKLPFLFNSSPGILRPPSRNDSTIFSAASANQSSATLNEIFPSLYAKHRHSGSLPVLDQIQQLMQFANTFEKKSSLSHNSISTRLRSLSCSDSEDMPVKVSQKTSQNEKDRAQIKNLSLSSESSSGVSSMDLVKNFEKVEKWCKNSSNFIDNYKHDENLDDEGMSNTTYSECKPKPYGHRKYGHPYGHRKPLTPDLFVNKNSNRKVSDSSNNDGTYQKIHCIRISDNENCMMQESNQRSKGIAGNEVPTQDLQAIPAKSDVSPYEILEIAQYSRQSPLQRFQSLDQGCKAKKSNTISKNVSHSAVSSTNSISNQHPGCFDDDFSKSEEKISIEATENPELIDDERYVERYFSKPEKEVSKTRMDYEDISCTATNCSRNQYIDEVKSALIGNHKNKRQSYQASELTRANHPVKEIKRNVPVVTTCHHDHEIPKKSTSNFLRNDIAVKMNNEQRHCPKMVHSSQKETCDARQHLHISELNKETTNPFKNMFVTPGKLVKNVSNGFSSHFNLWKPTNVQQHSQYPEMKTSQIEEVNSRVQHPQAIRMESNVHLVPITIPRQPRVVTQPQKTMTLKGSLGEESRHTANVFMNPIYATAGTPKRIPGRCQQIGVLIPQRKAPALYDASWSSRKKPSVGFSHGSTTLIPSYWPYLDNCRHSRKTFRRFI